MRIRLQIAEVLDPLGAGVHARGKASPLPSVRNCCRQHKSQDGRRSRILGCSERCYRYSRSMARSETSTPRIVFAGAFEGDGNYPDHRHEHAWELIYLREGSITERSGKDSFEMGPGSFVVHPPGTIHGDSAGAKYLLYHVLVTAEQPLKWPRTGYDPQGGAVNSLLDMVVREWYSNGVHREAFLRHSASLLDILMKRCALQAEESQDVRNVVTAVCGYFRREFFRSINLDDLAQSQGISRSTLYSYFHRVLGKTPLEVLDSIRVRNAVYLLKHSQLSVAEIARGSGYCSSSHLGRKLQIAYGMTPRQVRASCVEAEPKPDHGKGKGVSGTIRSD